MFLTFLQIFLKNSYNQYLSKKNIVKILLMKAFCLITSINNAIYTKQKICKNSTVVLISENNFQKQVWCLYIEVNND